MVAPAFWLPQTKFQPPRLRDDLVLRPQLLELLDNAAGFGAVVLVAAPAGYGKTTLVTSWLHKQPSQQAHQRYAWLSLDEEDDDPHIFLVGLVGALQRLNPLCGARLLAALNEPPHPATRLQRSIGLLVNDILAILPDPFVLVLDDLHAVSDPAIFAALQYFIEHQPDQMQLVILTREDPPLNLARLRARRRLTELRMPELRFTPNEVADLFHTHLQIDLAPDDVRALATSTEGWIAGLRLSAGALATRSAAERTAVISHIVAGNRSIFDLLASEVLDRQPLLIRRFLLATSILDTLTAKGCAAVLDTVDAGLLLHELYRRNLFLIATSDHDGVDATYRYHALFAAFLRRQLAIECHDELPTLHRRAAACLDPAQSIAHYLAADALEEAAQTIEQIAGDSFSRGQFGRLQSWIESLPTDMMTTHPWLAYYLGAIAWGQSRLGAAQPYLETALAGFETNGDARGQGETLVLLATVQQTNGAFALAYRLFEQARPLPISTRSNAQLLMGLAWLGLGSGDDAHVAANLHDALDLVERTGETSALHIVALQLRELFGVLPAGRAAMERLCRLSDTSAGTMPTTLAASVASLRAALCLLHGQRDGALRHTDRALEHSAQLGDPPWLCNSLDFFSAVVYETAGRRIAADRAITRLRATLDELPGWYSARAFAIGSILLQRGDLAAARAIATDMDSHAASTEWPVATSARLLFHGLLALHDQRFAEAEQLILTSCQHQVSYSLCSLHGDAHLVLAALYIRWRRPAQARPVLAHALGCWRATALPGLHLLLGVSFLDSLLAYAQTNDIEADWTGRVRSLLQQETPHIVVIPETGSTLTAREMDVLRLMAAGASNQIIADTLVMSLPTAKTHVAHILAKLQATTRTQAAARARALGLL